MSVLPEFVCVYHSTKIHLTETPSFGVQPTCRQNLAFCFQHAHLSGGKNNRSFVWSPLTVWERRRRLIESSAIDLRLWQKERSRLHPQQRWRASSLKFNKKQTHAAWEWEWRVFISRERSLAEIRLLSLALYHFLCISLLICDFGSNHQRLLSLLRAKAPKP